MPSTILNQLVKGLKRRYRYTYRRDKQTFLRTIDYYSNSQRLFDIFYAYNIFEISFFVLRFIFKVFFWWPILWPYVVFCYLVRYIFIPWHYLFLDFILPDLEKRGGGVKKVEKSYFYRAVRLIYRAVAWVERFLVNFFGVTLLWRWCRDLLTERFPDFIERNSDNIAYGILYFLEAFVWVWKTWSRLWDYVMSWFNPWSYWKTRYYLSSYFREKVGRRYTIYHLKLSVAYYGSEFYIRYYVALYFYGIEVFFISFKFFFSKVFLFSHYNYYRYYTMGKILVLLSYYTQKIFDIVQVFFPETLARVLSLYWRIISFFLPPIKIVFRFFYRYKIAPRWRWIKLGKKGQELGKGKFAGKWYPWFTRRPRP